ncbi:ribosome silencing factor [Rubrivivax gelatinosus]|uniref:Ribosomal silencing factor RsfS n=1 Tax=Rubrivivax gelatinosus TaxID=28068 RepID=A0ABS1DYG8_RUBGE|nr:ribosome silencing factor [Rubrivivax gelatinosus]MBK1614054.1 ribosome silencing factor [Rubrivivax gelatinosus]MBK1714245.1 ribosome silencing factor [Rubrivivax gelatinosus]
MDIRKLQRAIVDGLEDVKAQNIAVFNTESLSPLFERVIIATATSNRQTKALASSVRDTVKSRGMEVLSTEGEDNGEWVIVDCGQAVAHIMQPAIREYYHLEEIWGGKAVRIKLGVVGGLVKASEPMDEEPKQAGKKPPKKKKASDKTLARNAARPAAKKAAAGRPAAKTPARKTAARKTTSRSDADLPVTTVKVQPARKLAVKKPAARSAPAARKPAPRPAAKTPARKTAPRKTAR